MPKPISFFGEEIKNALPPTYRTWIGMYLDIIKNNPSLLDSSSMSWIDTRPVRIASAPMPKYVIEVSFLTKQVADEYAALLAQIDPEDFSKDINAMDRGTEGRISREAYAGECNAYSILKKIEKAVTSR